MKDAKDSLKGAQKLLPKMRRKDLCKYLIEDGKRQFFLLVIGVFVLSVMALSNTGLKSKSFPRVVKEDRTDYEYERAERSVVIKKKTSIIDKNRRLIMSSLDASADEKLTANELAWGVQRRMAQHQQKALRANMRTFFDLDKKGLSDGQVAWTEWLEAFKEKEADLDERSLAEKLSYAKAAWFEAARSNPEKLNIDEFLSFTHPEFSHPLILQEAVDTLNVLDRNGDGELTLEEFAFNVDEGESKRREALIVDLDTDGNGALSRNELLPIFNPKSEIWAMNQARKMLDSCDSDSDGKLNAREVDDCEGDILEPLFPEKMYHSVF